MQDKIALGKLGKYELLEKIGEGGYGAVYRGHDTKMGRQIAIKVLHTHLASSPEFIERFRREALLASSLRHPNIITVTDLDEQSGQYFLIMDYLPGGSLERLLVDGKPLPLARAVELLAPLASALDYAHSRNIIHRDLKPSNIMFTAEGAPVLTDFGLVKSTIEESGTSTGTVLGTVEYMAPEQIRGLGVKPATDLYALGIVAYQMLTGRVPFKGNTPFDIQTGHVNQSPPDPRSINPSLPESVATVLQKALAKDPDQRYSSGSGFVNALSEIANQYNLQQATQLLNEAKDKLAAFRFDEAMEQIQRVLAISKVPEAETLLVESQRRKQIWSEVERLRHQQSQITGQLTALAAPEPWLPKSDPSSAERSLPHVEQKARVQSMGDPDTLKIDNHRQNRYLKVNIWATFILLVVTLIFIISLPPSASLALVHYINPPYQSYQYFISPWLMGFLIGLVLLLWADWAFRRDRNQAADAKKQASAHKA